MQFVVTVTQYVHRTVTRQGSVWH